MLEGGKNVTNDTEAVLIEDLIPDYIYIFSVSFWFYKEPSWLNIQKLNFL